MKKRRSIYSPRTARHIPRIPHVHRMARIVKVRGMHIRYGCNECPKLDPWRHDPRTVRLLNSMTMGKLVDAARPAVASLVTAGKAVQDVATGLAASFQSFRQGATLTNPKGQLVGWAVDSDGRTPDEDPVQIIKRNARKDDDSPVPVFDTLGLDSLKLDSVSLIPADQVINPHAVIQSVEPVTDSTNDPVFHSMCTVDNHDGCLSPNTTDRLQSHVDDIVGTPPVMRPRFVKPTTAAIDRLIDDNELAIGDAMLDADHPHATITEPAVAPEDATLPDTYTKDELSAMPKGQVYLVATTLNIPRRSAMTKAGLITAILDKQST